MTEVDVLIVGAGLSGIGAAYRLQTRLPRLRFTILEAGDAIGGTWNHFRYPGVRSDSDMFTFAYPWKPWLAKEVIADGAKILDYLRDSAAEHGIVRHIRFGHRVVRAEWSSGESRWTVEAQVDGAPRLFTCRFLYVCSGYYSYDRAHAPTFPDQERFRGQVVHPQWWPAGLETAGKRVVVLGSGATAITLVPALAETAAHVTMLQRSPTYVATLPARDGLADLLRAVLPKGVAHLAARFKNVLLVLAIYKACRRWPDLARRLFVRNARAHLPKELSVEHFSPRYAPWDQRVCVAPNADIFRVLRQGKASVMTDTIERFTENGLRLASGAQLDADVVVTATGLELLAIGGIHLNVDGRDVDVGKTIAYKGLMLSDVPNFAWCVGYINASWGLRADLASRYICRLLDFMERHGYAQATARAGPGVRGRPVMDLSAGYVQRGGHRFPKQGSDDPFVLHQNYLREYFTMLFGRIDDDGLELVV